VVFLCVRTEVSMNISLADALQQVRLEPGRTYQCQLGNLRVEVRVTEDRRDPLPTPLRQDDIRLDPWTDLPTPKPVNFLQAVPAGPVLPDVPDIPGE